MNLSFRTGRAALVAVGMLAESVECCAFAQRRRKFEFVVTDRGGNRLVEQFVDFCREVASIARSGGAEVYTPAPEMYCRSGNLWVFRR